MHFHFVLYYNKNMIKIFITTELYKVTPSEEIIEGFKNRVQSLLFDIQEEVEEWNGSVELQETKDGNFHIIAHCENQKTRNLMQLRLKKMFC